MSERAASTGSPPASREFGRLGGPFVWLGLTGARLPGMRQIARLVIVPAGVNGRSPPRCYYSTDSLSSRMC